MPGRTVHEAYSQFIEPIQAAVACIARAKIMVSPGGSTNAVGDHSWVLAQGGTRVQLAGAFGLAAAMKYRFVSAEDVGHRWRVSTRSYKYAIYEGDKELLGYHWHPDGPSHVRTPHVHVGIPALSTTGVITPHTHVETGRVAFEAIIRLIIREFNVQPLATDWQRRLDQSERRFRRHRSWG